MACCVGNVGELLLKSLQLLVCCLFWVISSRVGSRSIVPHPACTLCSFRGIRVGFQGLIQLRGLPMFRQEVRQFTAG
jgi:hypothetical protein